MRLLADGEDYGDMRPSVSDLDLLSFAEFARPSCQICYDLLNTSTSGSLLADFGPTMSMSEWVNHVMSKYVLAVYAPDNRFTPASSLSGIAKYRPWMTFSNTLPTDFFGCGAVTLIPTL